MDFPVASIVLKTLNFFKSRISNYEVFFEFCFAVLTFFTKTDISRSPSSIRDSSINAGYIGTTLCR